MVDVPSARAFGFRMTLHKSAMRAVLNSAGVKQRVNQEAQSAAGQVKARANATISAVHAANYGAALIVSDTTSNALGMNFGGPYGLGNRPVTIIGVPSGRGSNPKAMPPLMVEAKTHALSSVPGFKVGSTGERI